MEEKNESEHVTSANVTLKKKKSKADNEGDQNEPMVACEGDSPCDAREEGAIIEGKKSTTPSEGGSSTILNFTVQY